VYGAVEGRDMGYLFLLVSIAVVMMMMVVVVVMMMMMIMGEGGEPLY